MNGNNDIHGEPEATRRPRDAVGEQVLTPLPPGQVVDALPTVEEVALLRTLLDSALDIVIAHTPEGRLVYFNKTAYATLGYTEAEFAGLSAYGWVGADAMTTAPGRLEAILHRGQLTFASTLRCKDGTLIPSEVRASRLDSRFGPLIVAVIRDISERIEAQQTILHLAYHDKLTGLGNRALFDDRMDVAMADAVRHGDVLGVAFVDIDEFKPVNDAHGHAVGDTVLIEIGRRLESVTRRQDTVARLGGDEFIVILPRIGNVLDLAKVGRKLALAIRQPFIVPDGPPVQVIASVGLAVFDPQTDDARSLLTKADAAMYAAKDDPVCDWCLYEEGMYGPIVSNGEAET